MSGGVTGWADLGGASPGADDAVVCLLSAHAAHGMVAGFAVA